MHQVLERHLFSLHINKGPGQVTLALAGAIINGNQQALALTTFPGIGQESVVAKSAQPLLLYVGMLKRYKGIDILIRAFARVRAAVPGARLAFAGKGNDRPRLEALVRTLGLADCVSFEGWVSEEEKIDWLRRANALVYPSVKEGWGIPTMEAAACATPTLASDVAGLRDAVRDGVTGFLIPHEDVEFDSRQILEKIEAKKSGGTPPL